MWCRDYDPEPEHLKRFGEVIRTEIYGDFKDGKYARILDLLFNQQISPGKAATAIAEISLGYTPDLPEVEIEN